MRSTANLKHLTDYGFGLLTSWQVRNGKTKPDTTEWDVVSGWIYAFVEGRTVRYIGIATTVLRSRLDGDSYQINDRVGAEVLRALKYGKDISIYGVKRRGVSKEALEREESALIARFDTLWNVRR